MWGTYHWSQIENGRINRQWLWTNELLKGSKSERMKERIDISIHGENYKEPGIRSCDQKNNQTKLVKNWTPVY